MQLQVPLVRERYVSQVLNGLDLVGKDMVLGEKALVERRVGLQIGYLGAEFLLLEGFDDLLGLEFYFGNKGGCLHINGLG